MEGKVVEVRQTGRAEHRSLSPGQSSRLVGQITEHHVYFLLSGPFVLLLKRDPAVTRPHYSYCRRHRPPLLVLPPHLMSN